MLAAAGVARHRGHEGAAIADSTSNVVKGGVAKVHQRAQKAIQKQVSAGSADKDGRTAVTIKAPGKRLLKQQSSESSSADWMKELMTVKSKKQKSRKQEGGEGEDFDDDVNDDAHVGEGRSGKKKRMHWCGSSGNFTEASSSATKLTPIAKRIKAGMEHVYPSIQQREVNRSKAIESATDSFLETVANTAGLKIMTVQKIETQLAKVLKRLEPEIARRTNYCRDEEGLDLDAYDDNDADVGALARDGVRVVRSLEVQKGRLELLKDLVQCLEAEGSATATSLHSSTSYLHDLIQQCKAAGMTVSFYAATTFFIRQCHALFDGSHAGAVLPALKNEAVDDVYGIWLVGDKPEALQKAQNLAISAVVEKALAAVAKDAEGMQSIEGFFQAWEPYDWVLWGSVNIDNPERKRERGKDTNTSKGRPSRYNAHRTV